MSIRIDNLHFYTTDEPHFYYLINGRYYDAEDLREIDPEEEPFEEGYDVEPFDFEPIALILTNDYTTDSSDVMLYQQNREGNLLELTPRP